MNTFKVNKYIKVSKSLRSICQGPLSWNSPWFGERGHGSCNLVAEEPNEADRCNGSAGNVEIKDSSQLSLLAWEKWGQSASKTKGWGQNEEKNREMAKFMHSRLPDFWGPGLMASLRETRSFVKMGSLVQCYRNTGEGPGLDAGATRFGNSCTIF